MAEVAKTERVERAIRLFNSGNNCAQATLLAFSDIIGTDEDNLRKTAFAFGGGLCGSREVCGAVTGMLMALGNIRGSADVTDTGYKHKLYGEGRTLIEDFIAEFGTMNCGELSGTVAKGFRENPHPLVTDPLCRPCTAFVAYAAAILEEYLTKNE